MRRRADDAPVHPCDRPKRSLRTSEPPVELVAADRSVAPRVAQQTQVVRPIRGRVRLHLERHYFVEVPSAAFNSRRACVPVTVSFNEIRSHAPERTSSNVRGGYGSML